LEGLTLATSGFTFGGTNNELTLNSVTAAEEEADAATIEDAIMDTVPPSVNTFAPTTPSMNTGRCCATSTLLPNGKVLIAGGQHSSFNPLNSSELYDPVSNTFTATPTMNTARESAAATLLPNGKVLIAGGLDSPNTLSSTELYTP
jgi:hypothetical protein